MHLIIVKVEILRLHGRRKGTDRLQRRSPQTGNHIHRKRQRGQRHEETEHADLRIVIIVRELDFAQQVEAQQRKKHNPQGEERLTVEDAPAVSQIGHRKEFQGKGQLQEAERHLDDVHPSTGLGHGLQPGREQGKQRERQCQSYGKAQHADGGSHHAARRGNLHQQESDNGSRAGERYQRQGKCHQEDAEQTACRLGLAVYSRTPLGGQRYLERSEEGSRKHHQHQAEKDIEYCIRRECVQCAGSENKRDCQSERHINHHDGSAIRPRIADALLLVLAAFQEEADRHRDDGPYTGGEERQQSAGKSRNENINPGHVFLRSGFAQRIQFTDDRLP